MIDEVTSKPIIREKKIRTLQKSIYEKVVIVENLFEHDIFWKEHLNKLFYDNIYKDFDSLFQEVRMDFSNNAEEQKYKSEMLSNDKIDLIKYVENSYLMYIMILKYLHRKDEDIDYDFLINELIIRYLFIADHFVYSMRGLKCQKSYTSRMASKAGSQSGKHIDKLKKNFYSIIKEYREENRGLSQVEAAFNLQNKGVKMSENAIKQVIKEIDKEFRST